MEMWKWAKAGLVGAVTVFAASQASAVTVDWRAGVDLRASSTTGGAPLANLTNNGNCHNATFCDFEVDLGGDAGVTTISLSAPTKSGDQFNAFAFTTPPQGLAIGFLETTVAGENGTTLPISFDITFTTQDVNTGVLWNGGAFAGVDGGSDGAGADGADEGVGGITISGDGDSETLFAGQTEFNTAANSALSQAFSIQDGFFFENGVTYTITSENGTSGDPAFITFANWDIEGSDGVADEPVGEVPLPAPALMLLSALGFFGWRRYRA